MLQRLAAWSYRRRRRVVILWIVALVAKICTTDDLVGVWS